MVMGRRVPHHPGDSRWRRKHDPLSVRSPGWRIKGPVSKHVHPSHAHTRQTAGLSDSPLSDHHHMYLDDIADEDECNHVDSGQRWTDPAPRTGLMGRVWRLFGRLIGLLCMIVIVVQAYFLVQIGMFRWFDPPSSAFMRSEAVRLAQLSKGVEFRHQWVGYDNISRHAGLAVIAAEDTGFMSHPGIEWQAIERALKVNRESGEIAQGGSTITMQLAKNLFLSSDRSYVRKGQEVLLAVVMELLLDKRRILELYLNLVEFGEGVFGIEAAAEHYFKTSAEKLTARQAAWLASILPAPKRYDKNRNSNWIQRKTGIVMRRMPQVQAP